MNRLLHPIVLLVTGVGMVRAEPDGRPVDAGPVLAALRAEISAKPSRVLIAVEDALTVNEQAACEIVKEAINATRADATLVGEIVFAALQRAPAMAATIVECAIATAPQAVEQIKGAMRRALGDRAASAGGDAKDGSEKPASDEPGGLRAGSGKESRGKAVAAEAAPSGETDDSFRFFGLGVGGIYLSTPGSSWLHPCDPGDPCCNNDLTPACLQP